MNKWMRTFHRKASPWLFALLIVSAVTGMSYRVGRAWFGMTKPTGDAIMNVHTGSWIGSWASPFYILLVGGGLVFLLVTGGVLLVRSKARQGARAWHRWAAFVMLLPLAITAVTGILCGLDGAWYSLPKNVSRFAMTLHEGRWLGQAGRPFYVLFVGLGLLVLGAAGLRLTGLFRRGGR